MNSKTRTTRPAGAFKALATALAFASAAFPLSHPAMAQDVPVASSDAYHGP